MSDAVLVINAGSSSIKFSVFPGHGRPSQQDIICEGECKGIGHRVRFTAKDRTSASLVDEYLADGTTHEDALAALLRRMEDHFLDDQLVAAGHRVVYDGSLYTAPVLIDASMTAELRRIIPLAPLHQPHNLAAIAAIPKLHPTLPQLACFDTAFYPSAKEAVALFVYRIGRELGSLAAALGGTDALVLTAGMGEHAAEIRRRVCEDAAWLGLELDQSANAVGGAMITHLGSRTSAWVIPTDEDLMIAGHAWTLLNPEAAPLDPHRNNGS